ncbi:MAG TPA: hypothetical protein VGT41_06820 [Candidatus Babeliales bacterium]|nr:hypothetical protein [Candidatus Babeliales bacterium]
MKVLCIYVLAGIILISSSVQTVAMQSQQSRSRELARMLERQREQQRRNQELERRDAAALERLVRRATGPTEAAPRREPLEQPRRVERVPAVAAQPMPSAEEVAAQEEHRRHAEVLRERKRREEEQVKARIEQLQKGVLTGQNRKQELTEQEKEQALRLQKLEQNLAKQKTETEQRQAENTRALQIKQQSVEAQKAELQKRVSFANLKEQQKERLPDLIKNLMEPLLTALIITDDKGARRNVRYMIQRMIQGINKGRPAYEGHIPQDNPDNKDITALLIPSIGRQLAADRQLVAPADSAFIDLLRALHAGDLQQAIYIARTAYRGSSSFGNDFKIENFEHEYKNTVAGIALIGMFDHGKPFEFLLQLPQGDLAEQLETIRVGREKVRDAMLRDLDISARDVAQDVRY